MDSGLSSGAADAAGARGLPARPGMPPEAPASMPSQALGTFDAAQRRVPRSPGGLPSAPWRRLIVLIGAALLAGIATNEMRLVLAVGDLTGLEIAVLVLFALNIAWISAGAAMALAGFLRLAGRTVAKPLPSTAPLGGRTAVLVPMHNEDPARVGAALDAMGRSLAAQGAGASFDLVLLSDTTDGDLALAEHEVVQTLRSRLGESPAVHYRRRLRNTASKPGNIREFCERWGQAYDHLLMLDADSLMDGATMVELARRMEADPDVGLIQTVPRLHLGATLLGRLQQFAATVYGPTQSAGLAWWARSEGTYWGHNAILRTRSFLASAGLPTLSGKPPFGGPLLSHDFVEAALLRRAGWSVVIADDLEGSYEEGPASLLDLAARDRRWCQGNLQHVRLLTARGLHGVSRLHLVNGILAYLSSPLWLLFLLAALALGVQYQFARPDYFPDGPSLFPLWPRLDPVRAVRLFGLTLSILLVPKVLGLAWYAGDEARLRASGGPWLLVSFALEVLLSALLAPIMMLFHCASIASVLIGRDSGWKAQGRDGGGPRRDRRRGGTPGTWRRVSGCPWSPTASPRGCWRG